MSMKKLLFLLFAITLFYGCATIADKKPSTAQTFEADGAKTTIQPSPSIENEEEKAHSGKQLTLKAIYKQSEEDIKYLQNLESKNLLNTLSKEEQKNWKDVKAFVIEAKELLSPYTSEPIDATFVNFVAIASEEGYSEEEIFGFIDPKIVVSNPYCEDEFNSFKVFQVLNDSVLANGCEKTSYSECETYGMRIFILPKIENEIYFDNKILKPDYNECPTYLGTYAYTSINGTAHTVPIVVFTQKKITKMILADLIEKRKQTIQGNK